MHLLRQTKSLVKRMIRKIRGKFQIGLVIYPLFHFVFHEALHKIVEHVEDGRRMDVVHSFRANGCSILSDHWCRVVKSIYNIKLR